MPKHQPLMGRVAIPGGPLKARRCNGLRCKPSRGPLYAYQWLARHPVNQPDDNKLSGFHADQRVSGRVKHGHTGNGGATCEW